MDESSPETQLMESIRQKWGATIDAACKMSSVPASFLAALIANETGGDPTKSRFESKVFAELCMVCAGKQAHYGSLGINDLIPKPSQGLQEFNLTLKSLADFSSSWGLTQIMGYQVIEFGKKITNLTDPAASLTFTCMLLTQFANRFDLDLRTEFAQLFACWNCGQPDPSKTYDPQYCARGIARMALYSRLLAIQTPAPAPAQA
jgi:hypothetical protein